MRWYYYKDEQCKGPFEVAAIQQLVNSGEIVAETPMRTDAMGNWIPLEQAVNHFGRETPMDGALSSAPSSSPKGFALPGMVSYLLAGLSGLTMAALAGWLWAGISVALEMQIGYIAIGVGLAVGLAVRLLGDPYDGVYPVMAGIFSVLSIVFGNTLVILDYLSAELETSMLLTLQMFGFDGILEMLVEFTSPIDFIFYAIAIGGAYKVARTKSWLKQTD